MTHQELRQLKSGTLVKVKSQIFLWEEIEWDGIEERNGIFLKYLGENYHIVPQGYTPAGASKIRKERKKSIGTTKLSDINLPVCIIQLFTDSGHPHPGRTDGNVIVIEADPEFVHEIR